MSARRPAHIGFIPDGNRRWAVDRGRSKSEGYEDGVRPGLGLLEACVAEGIGEISIYGFTKANVHRPAEQVEAFKTACVHFGLEAVAHGAALSVVGDSASAAFPQELRAYAHERSPGKIRVNLVANYDWRWDLQAAGSNGRKGPRSRAWASSDIPDIDLVVRWGGRRRLSGFLPLQSAHADIYVVDTLWPDMKLEEFHDALAWYGKQDVTRGG